MEKSVILFVFFCGISAIQAAAAPNSTKSTKKLSATKALPPTLTAKKIPVAYVYAVDLDSCHCQSFDLRCEVSIGKSIIRENKTIDCPADHRYCCKGRTSPQKPDTKTLSTHSISKPSNNTNETEAQAPEPGQRSNQTLPRVHLIVPSLEKPETDSLNSTTPNLKSLPLGRKPKPQFKCKCKLRDKCESKYTDYTFGFHCSYDKVRCCEPQEGINKIQEAQMSRGNTSANSNTTTLIEEPLKEISCKCVSPDECSETENAGRNSLSTEKQKDALCPFNLIQCCGSQASRRSDAMLTDEQDEAYDSLNTDSEDKPDDDDKLAGAGINMIGQPAYLQPIQLPVLKIPAKEGSNETEPEQEVAPATPETLPPPDLPTAYDDPATPTQYYAPSQYAPVPAQPYWVPSNYAQLPPQSPSGQQNYGISSRSDVPGPFVFSTPSFPRPSAPPESSGFLSSIFGFFG